MADEKQHSCGTKEFNSMLAVCYTEYIHSGETFKNEKMNGTRR